jgi:hypothetical protein
VHSKDFENGVVRLQAGLESKLSQAERNAVKIVLREDAPPLHETAVQSKDFADIFLANKRCRVEASRYRSTLHVSATSNICERLFSNARLIMNHLCASMDPASCDMLLFLKFNSRFWTNPMIIDAVIAENDSDLDYTPLSENDDKETV